MKKAFTLNGENSLPPRGRAGVRGQQAFTLAEVLITLAIIGVVAAISIPSVISNAQQQEFKTGLRKAVSVLNSAITMNIALDGESPYDNGDLFRYLQRHMSVMKSTTTMPYAFTINYANNTYFGYTTYVGNAIRNNAAFYTTDGMRYEFRWDVSSSRFPLTQGAFAHEGDFRFNAATTYPDPDNKPYARMGCGSYGLTNNPNDTTLPPCKIAVDVNGDRKPYPANAASANAADNIMRLPAPNGNKVIDVFTLLITEDRAIPYGVVAQRAMYRAQK